MRGTGKSVVAIQLLCDLIQKEYSVNYVTKNAAPRNVYFEKLKQNNYKLNYIKNLFKGSGSYIGVPNNYFDCLIADEAHRLNAKSGMFQNLGENQIKEIIHASKVSVFLIDENSFPQVGCIHTSQGLEFDYCGVIIGKDLIYKDGTVQTGYLKRAKTDTSLKGIKTTKNYVLADRIIRNTYRTLLFRGQKGCFIYCEDKALLNYMPRMLNKETIK